ncbi:MAG TPA: hypothetical protein VKZ63_13700, partial [Kofleriaceae bacterium]|nr:hypothetical protein [Kofleriaceae bacterium]
IKRIDFAYSNLPGGGRARVQVWALPTPAKAGGGAAKPPKPTPVAWNSTGWTQLGKTVVRGKNATGVISVGKKEGKFTKMMIVVTDSEMALNGVEVQFSNGTKWSPQVKHFFRENERTRAIDFPGSARHIKKVTFKYGNLPGGGRATVEVWAR